MSSPENFRCAVLVRKTLSFSKKIENHIGAIFYFIHHDNETLYGKMFVSEKSLRKWHYPILYRAAIVAIRYNPHVKALYERLLARGKSKMAALGAAVRKLVHLCFGILKNRTPYQANDVKAA